MMKKKATNSKLVKKPVKGHGKLEDNKKNTKTVAKSKNFISRTTPKEVVKQRIQPLGDKVVVKPLSTEEMGTTTASGIIIPDTVSKDKPEQGKVVAVGEGRYIDGKLVPVPLKIGDRVVFSRYGYEEVKVDGVEYYIIKEESILAVIN